MTLSFRPSCLLAAAALALGPIIDRASAQPVLQDSVLQAIEAEALERGQVMEIARLMTDVYGPRLTGSPQLDRASAWAMDLLDEWGMSNVHLDDWGPFGRGWSLERFSIHATEPSVFVIHGYPKAWTSSTNGPVSGEVLIVRIEKEEDFAKYAGKLEGKFVLADKPRAVAPHFDPIAKRKTSEDLLNLANAPAPDGAGGRRYTQEQIDAYLLGQKVDGFLAEQRVAGILDNGWKGDLGTIAVAQASVPGSTSIEWSERRSAWQMDVDYVVPQVTVNSEDYNRLHRLVDSGVPVKVELDLRTRFHYDDPMEYNVIAEIPGTDPQVGDEVVMIGAHFDSWHAGTGATDNASGSAVMMETMRVLKEVYAKLGRGPRRTIRLALWTGEEQGLFGSRYYVSEHVAVAGDPGQAPISTGPDYDKISAYYNLDNGTGRIRGIYLQGNEGLRPIFREWFAPFAGKDASTISVANTTGTDHLSFDAVGVPGFQFIQDDIEYGPRTHHTNMDVFDRLVAEDLRFSVVVMASFVYNTSERLERLPRKTFVGETAQSGTN